jgi:hypothetical protein
MLGVKGAAKGGRQDMKDGQVLALNVGIIAVGCAAATLALGSGFPDTFAAMAHWLGATAGIIALALLIPALWWVLAGCRFNRLDGPLILAYVMLAAIIVTASMASSSGPSGPFWPETSEVTP